MSLHNADMQILTYYCQSSIEKHLTKSLTLHLDSQLQHVPVYRYLIQKWLGAMHG